MFFIRPSFHVLLAVTPLGDTKMIRACLCVPEYQPVPSALLLWWLLKQHGALGSSGRACLVFSCTAAFLYLETEAQEVISEPLDPLCARRIDHWQEIFVHAKLNWAATPRAAFKGGCCISTGIRGYTKYSKAFLYLEVENVKGIFLLFGVTTLIAVAYL